MPKTESAPMKAAFVNGLMLAAMIGLIVFTLIRVTLIAQDGRAAHRAACGQKAYYTAQVHDSQAFLRLTQSERTKLYGAVGDVPDPIIRAGLIKQQQLLAAFADLHC